MKYSEPVEPCPTCPEGWRPLDKEHCADCYEGQIERLKDEIKQWIMIVENLESQIKGMREDAEPDPI